VSYKAVVAAALSGATLRQLPYWRSSRSIEAPLLAPELHKPRSRVSYSFPDVELLPETPLVTARTVQRMLAVSPPAARTALEELANAKIVTRKHVERGTTGYFARDVFDLRTIAERRLASTHWDTRQSAPSRPVPALPQW
jgi:hypothetical protein